LRYAFTETQVAGHNGVWSPSWQKFCILCSSVSIFHLRSTSKSSVNYSGTHHL